MGGWGVCEEHISRKLALRISDFWVLFSGLFVVVHRERILWPCSRLTTSRNLACWSWDCDILLEPYADYPKVELSIKKTKIKKNTSISNPPNWDCEMKKTIWYFSVRWIDLRFSLITNVILLYASLIYECRQEDIKALNTKISQII